MKKIIIAILILSTLHSCHRKCILSPIPANVFDISKITGKNIILTSGKDTGSLVFIESLDSYQKESVKSPMAYIECEHVKSYEYHFRDEPITVLLRKHSDEKLTLELYGFFNTSHSEIAVTESDILKNKEFIFPMDTISKNESPIKEIVLKGYKIKSITTTDNKKWTPKEMF